MTAGSQKFSNASRDDQDDVADVAAINKTRKRLHSKIAGGSTPNTDLHPRAVKLKQAQARIKIAKINPQIESDLGHVYDTPTGNEFGASDSASAYSSSKS